MSRHSLALSGVAGAAPDGRRGNLAVCRAPKERHLLIVDDSQTDRCVLRWFAEACGCVVREACSLREMTAVMREWEPDVLVLDIVMPNSDGIEVMRLLRSEHCDLPLLLVTGCHRMLQPAYNLGAAYGLNVVDVIGKPVDAHRFKARLRRTFAIDA